MNGQDMNGQNNPGGVVGMVGNIGGRIVSSLPAQFLMLVLLNVIFILGLLWYLSRIDANRSHENEAYSAARERVLTPILDACLKKVPIEALSHLDDKHDTR